jgi:hypothetical protein
VGLALVAVEEVRGRCHEAAMDGRQPSGGAEGDRDRGESEEDEGPVVR